MRRATAHCRQATAHFRQATARRSAKLRRRLYRRRERLAPPLLACGGCRQRGCRRRQRCLLPAPPRAWRDRQRSTSAWRCLEAGHQQLGPVFFFRSAVMRQWKRRMYCRAACWLCWRLEQLGQTTWHQLDSHSRRLSRKCQAHTSVLDRIKILHLEMSQARRRRRRHRPS